MAISYASLKKASRNIRRDTDAKLSGGVAVVAVPKPLAVNDAASTKPPGKPAIAVSAGPKLVGTGSDERKAASGCH